MRDSSGLGDHKAAAGWVRAEMMRALNRRPRGRRRKIKPAPRRVGPTDGGDQDDCPDPVELILYVSAESPGPANAIRDIKRALSRYRSDRVTLTICDPSKDPASGTADRIAFTPLVKRSAGPRTFILGHITNSEILIELLEECDIES